MKFILEMNRSGIQGNGLETILHCDGLTVNAGIREASFTLNIDKNRRVVLFGEAFYHIAQNGKIRIIERNDDAYLKAIFGKNGLKEVISKLEGQYVGLLIDRKSKRVRVFSDRYARLDVFYAARNGHLRMGTDLDVVIGDAKPEYDQKMLATMLSVYGWYVPKGMTMYKGVKRLRVGEILTLSPEGISSEVIAFKPLPIEEYGDESLEEYYRLLRESVVARANRNGKTWISSSSGWDSTMLLGLLVDEFGPRNVQMVTGRMKYSDRTSIINKFEIDKVNQIGKFYGIKPEIVDLDFKSAGAPELWKKFIPYFRSKHIYTYTTYSFTKISNALVEKAEKGQVIFNGETADSFHNFGFAQYVTFFHTNKSFCEYADKMNCYLYGPSFFKKIENGSFTRDKIYQMFKSMVGGTFREEYRSRKEMIAAYLFPLFYGSPRIPFADTVNRHMLTARGCAAAYEYPFGEYVPEITQKMDDTNLYSWFIFLYHMFHSQGSTVSVQKYAMEFNDHKWRSPFNDYRLIDLLSKAPESWGRGLDLNNAKYPLKWVARNKIRFPYRLVESGPHSYLYDVIEGFSLLAEITYRSGVTPFFKEALRSRQYREILDERYFDVEYIDGLVKGFISGKEVKGKDFNNLVSIITLSIGKWY